MKYKGYEAIVTYDDEGEVFHGEVLHTKDVITFQGRRVDELKKAFRESVDDYLEFCRKRGEKPDKPFSGTLMIRIDPSLHRKLTSAAKKRRVSLNAFIAERLAS